MRSKLQNLRFPCCLAVVATVAIVATVGCDHADPAFRLNMVEAVSNDTGPEYQQEIADVLGAMFGTPDDPYALPETGLNIGRLRLAAGAAWSDEAGANHGLYRRHCVHCHGITGDGRGPTARFLNPYPRDYRPGIYKFKSTYLASKPTDEDLHRVLINGAPGTAMPSFALLPGSEVEALVEYVKYLSIRGQMETKLIVYVYDELGEEEAEDESGNPMLDSKGEPVMSRIALNPENDAEQREVILELLAEVMEGWNSANDDIIVPEEEQIPSDDRSPKEIADSVAEGRKLFYGIKANCVKCHGPTGLGDGQRDDQDYWNKAHKAFLASLASGTDPEIAAAKLEVADRLYPVRNSIPRDLRRGVYRGGRRPIEIFWKIYAGMSGTPMPGLGPADAAAKAKMIEDIEDGVEPTITEAEMWNIVDYVLSLPYEAPSQPQKALPKNPSAISSAR